MPRALLTGITGFIGGRLAERLLLDGWQVDAIVRPGSNVDMLSFRDAITFHVAEDGAELTPTLVAARPDVVFHLASLYLADHRSDQVEALIRSNILFPTLLAEAMATAGVQRLVNTGTAWQHYGTREYLPVNLYAATKQAADDLLIYYSHARDISSITLRLFDTYGRSDKRRKLIQILVDAARSGEKLAMSPGEQVVDMTHVDDVVEAFLLSAARLMEDRVKQPETYYVSGERHTVKDLASIVSQTVGQPIYANFGGRPYRSREVMRPIEVQDDQMVPGWRATRSLRDEIMKL